MRLKIQSPGPTAKSANIWIDGVERSHDVVSVRLSMGVNEVTHATIEFILRDGVDLDVEGDRIDGCGSGARPGGDQP